MAIEKEQVPVKFSCTPEGENVEWKVVFDPITKKISFREEIYNANTIPKEYPIGLLSEVVDFLRSENLIENSLPIKNAKSPQTQSSVMDFLAIPNLEDGSTVAKKSTVAKNSTVNPIDILSNSGLATPVISVDPVTSFDIDEQVNTIHFAEKAKEVNRQENKVNTPPQASQKQDTKRRVIREGEDAEAIRASMANPKKKIKSSHKMAEE